MQRPKTSPSQELITIAERILSETFDSSIQLVDAEDLQGGSRSYVYRFKVLDASSDTLKSVIVKQAKSSKDSIYAPDKATVPNVEETPYYPAYVKGSKYVAIMTHPSV